MRAMNRPLLVGFLLLTTLALTVLLLLPAASAAGIPSPSRWQEKVDPAVLAQAGAGEESEFLLFLQEQADLAPAARLPTKAQKGAFVTEQLRQTARQSQGPVIQALAAAGAEYRPYWIANMIWVRGDEQLIRQLARRPDVAHLYANPRVRMPEPAARTAAPLLPAGIEWGINKVNAPDVWAEGFTGQNIVVGGQDTGYQWDHPALKEQYRGWDGQAVDHNYNWHDAIHADSNTGGSSSCGVDLALPCDDHGHGTHTMGTMVGDDGAGNQIGMAPGARWIGCRNMEGGWGTPTTYSECFQWFLAPTDLNGQNPDPSRAPHVINNSWSCPPAEGCTDPTVLQTVVENVRQAGIVVVVSAGNYGPDCGSIYTPAAIYEASFTVGATDSTDTIASFSSRGPVTVDGSNRRKPDISAPGVFVRSSLPPDSYGYLSGTSMAGPHVAGQVALILSASPSLVGQVDKVETLIEQTAVPLTTTEECGGDSSTAVPNHTYGYGRIDVWSPALALTKTTPVTSVVQGDFLTYTLTVTNIHYLNQTTNVVLTDAIPAGTTLISATRPFTLDQGMVSWYTSTLPAGRIWQVNLVVQVTLSPTGTVPRTAPGPVSPLSALAGQRDAVEFDAIVNAHYGVRSDETATSGRPVITRLPAPDSDPIYFPLIRGR